MVECVKNVSNSIFFTHFAFDTQILYIFYITNGLNMKKLRRIRLILATIFFVAATALFLDFTGSIHSLLGIVARVQFIPAILALNVGVILMLILLTLIFGRLYCSVICPLGVTQDVISRLASAFNKKRKYSYSKPQTILRWSVLALFVAAMVAGVGSVVALLEPYSAFGRIVSNIFAPIYKLGNNALAYFAERMDSYAFYSTEIVVMGVGTLVVAILTLGVVGYLAWRGGRTYCNTICPVGTILGFLSRFSLLKIYIDKDLCKKCQKCVHDCKSGCITPDGHDVDYSRCVACYNCIESCNFGAVSYKFSFCKGKEQKTVEKKEVNNSRRTMLTLTTAAVATSILDAKAKSADGGLAVIIDKKVPCRELRLVPPGAESLRNFASHCTGCQLCVSVCPNQVLRPSTGLTNFMQPELSYERGYCRPECTKCSEVCPAGAIKPIDRAEKSSIQIGHAVVIEKNCVVLTDGVDCGNCAAHCPTGAISMIKAKDREKYGDRLIPVVDTERCIGCGACEHLCPARPFSAIYVEGHSMHKNI